MSKIEWTGETWNPITGCTKVSPGCTNCYAEIMARRLKAMGLSQYQQVINGKGKWSGHIEFVESTLDVPLKRKKPQIYFVNSMSDLFHPMVGIEWLNKIWFIMAQTPQHTYQILTKRATGLELQVSGLVRKYGVLPNVWLGVSVEDQQRANERIPWLLRTPAAVRFLSCEPLLGSIDLDMVWPGGMPYPMDGPYVPTIHWVIVGGESGPKARPMNPEWARSIRDQCQAANVPFFFKQWGGKNKKTAGNLLDGQVWQQMPDVRLAEVE